jgi:hypothetical protein
MRSPRAIFLATVVALAVGAVGCSSEKPRQQAVVAPAPAPASEPCAEYEGNPQEKAVCLQTQVAMLEQQLNTRAPNGVVPTQYQNDDSFLRQYMTYMVLRDLLMGPGYGYRLGYGWMPSPAFVVPPRYYGYSYYGRSFTPTTFRTLTTNQRAYATAVRANPRAQAVYGGRTVKVPPTVTTKNVTTYQNRYKGTLAPGSNRQVSATPVRPVGGSRTTQGAGVTVPAAPRTAVAPVRTAPVAAPPRPAAPVIKSTPAPAFRYQSAPRSSFGGGGIRSGGFGGGGVRSGGFSG